jgi:hypothetical protein
MISLQSWTVHTVYNQLQNFLEFSVLFNFQKVTQKMSAHYFNTLFKHNTPVNTLVQYTLFKT